MTEPPLNKDLLPDWPQLTQAGIVFYVEPTTGLVVARNLHTGKAATGRSPAQALHNLKQKR